MESKLTLANFYTHPRFWRHFKAWTILIVFLLINIGISFQYNPDESLHHEMSKIFCFLLELILLIYSSFYAYNKFVPKQQYLYFFLSLLIIVPFFSYVDGYFNTTAVQIGELKGFVANLLIFPVFLTIALGFKLAYHGARQLFVIQRLKNQQTESELQLLKSQINPHFLFNTLNNIYSTNLDDHEKANDIILELADLLRYQLESNKKPSATLADEIKSLENYVDLEKIRVKDCEVQIEKEGDFTSAQIVPLLLLPFVENAFKYGTGIEPGKIDIRFHLNEKRLFSFYCQNKIVLKKGKTHSGGIGLENVKKRLELKYQHQYQLDIDESNDVFTVELNIQL